MHIERRHNVGKEEAIHKIDTFLDDLMRRQFPGDVAIKEASRSWSDNVMRFSFKVKKGFFGSTISGVIRVNDDSREPVNAESIRIPIRWQYSWRTKRRR